MKKKLRYAIQKSTKIKLKWTSSSFTKQSCSKMALYRWIRTESRWNKKLISLSSPDWSASLRPSLLLLLVRLCIPSRSSWHLVDWNVECRTSVWYCCRPRQPLFSRLPWLDSSTHKLHTNQHTTHTVHHGQTASHRTVHILFFANDRRLRDYDLVVAHCCQQFDYCTIIFDFVTY